MKTITIYQKNDQPIVLTDNTPQPPIKLAEELKAIFTETTITIIQTSEEICLIRPSLISSITIKDDHEPEVLSDEPVKD